ncbi:MULTISPECIES: Fe-S cluster assembly sulfur transfer protein SufU [unclassified Curtobacterium]|uniref:Fe-S cluster assembly sulfur transfer protein SufU n=1 Tax=unclassified Curtobacterium TaxID=257496 RepID=UPI00052A834F|nr:MULTISPECIES: SUF system NifU family Fe-S cluster assembly protein [unclassified Curtobacterium]AIV40629.1 nitrogen fixation protein NifU [Curtobacterium sp. MR_MD2014]MBP1302145.1 nitrogen fixation NifU-like protein [Curtobacterium sp. 1310]MCM3504281.1 SUF system NifU family Fe-S cluster assembly protein [Curtobacterium sp. ODYSSEY 48 V2]MDT0211063.1 SUF system NifU family Fe-S cluster assembly protein [Curtobacterium sp. BRD11]
MNGLDSLYQQVILDHAKARHGDGVLDGADASHFERNPTCGDEITVSVRLEPGSDRIAAIGWQGDGCSISMASASVLTDMAVGRTVPELLELTESFRTMMRSRGAGEPDEDVLEDLVAFHGVSKFVMRVKCGMLAWVAAEAAVREATAV